MPELLKSKIVENERKVGLSDAAVDDLFEIYLYLAERIGSERAKGYTSRIETFCLSLGRFSERGRARGDLADGMRCIVFESQAVIAYRVEGDAVNILRVIHGAQDFGPDLFG